MLEGTQLPYEKDARRSQDSKARETRSRRQPHTAVSSGRSQKRGPHAPGALLPFYLPIINVVFKLTDSKFLLRDDPFHDIAKGENALQSSVIEDRQMADLF